MKEALPSTVTNHSVNPRIKLSIYKWLDMVYAPGWEKMELFDLYRPLDFLCENIKGIEDALSCEKP